MPSYFHTYPYRSSYLITPKPCSQYDKNFRQIYHLLHPKEKSINDHILDEVGELRYTRFQKVLDLIFKAGRYSIIIKKNVKDVF